MPIHGGAGCGKLEADFAVVLRDAGAAEEVVLVGHAYHLGLPGGERRRRLITACELVLGKVQEFVAEATALPWPGEKVMPPPHVTVRDGSLMCRYGSSKDPILVLPPVALSSLGIDDA